MIIIFVLFGLLFSVLLIGKINLSNQFKQQVKELISQSNNIGARTFTYDQLISLPEPVQRYFKQVLQEGQPYISYVKFNLTEIVYNKPGKF